MAVLFQAIQTHPTVQYGPVRDVQNDARQDLIGMTGSMSGGHVRELYGRDAQDNARKLAAIEPPTPSAGGSVDTVEAPSFAQWSADYCADNGHYAGCDGKWVNEGEVAPCGCPCHTVPNPRLPTGTTVPPYHVLAGTRQSITAIRTLWANGVQVRLSCGHVVMLATEANLSIGQPWSCPEREHAGQEV